MTEGLRDLLCPTSVASALVPDDVDDRPAEPLEYLVSALISTVVVTTFVVTRPVAAWNPTPFSFRGRYRPA